MAMKLRDLKTDAIIEEIYETQFPTGKFLVLEDPELVMIRKLSGELKEYRFHVLVLDSTWEYKPGEVILIQEGLYTIHKGFRLAGNI
jgi:hypothetical protein